MRKQYHFRPSTNGFFAWDVHRLIDLSKSLPVLKVPLDTLSEIDEPYWFAEGERPSVREIMNHCGLIQDADISYPIILSKNGRIMDGMHRVAKAAGQGYKTIKAVRFAIDPEPDYVDVMPDDLPY